MRFQIVVRIPLWHTESTVLQVNIREANLQTYSTKRPQSGCRSTGSDRHLPPLKKQIQRNKTPNTACDGYREGAERP